MTEPLTPEQVNGILASRGLADTEISSLEARFARDCLRAIAEKLEARIMEDSITPTMKLWDTMTDEEIFKWCEENKPPGFPDA